MGARRQRWISDYYVKLKRFSGLIMNEIRIEYGVSQLNKVAKQCVQAANNMAVVTLTGSLGAGKTTLVSAIMKEWGVNEPVISPTFTYMNVYTLADGRTAYHFDLYRLDSLESFEQAGFAEYLYQKNSVCLIEWPEIIIPLLRRSVCHIAIDFLGLDKRIVTIQVQQ